MAFCGIDVGTQGVRAAIVDASGRALGGGAAPVRSSYRAPGRHEQLPQDWWPALVTAVRAAVTAAGSPTVDALALDGTSGTVLVEDAYGSPRGPALMYDDARAAAEAERAQRVGEAVWRSLGYRMQPSWALPKVLWLLGQGALRPGDRVVHQADHLLRRLTGGPVPTDTSTALKTGVDLRSADWPHPVLAELGVAAELLPEVVLPGTPIGRICTDAARELGLRAGVPIRAGMTDGCASQIAAGALRPGTWSSALGTTLVVKGSTRELVHDPSGAVYSHRHPDDGWLPGGASSTGAGALAETFPGTDLDELTAAAAELVPVGGVTYPLTGKGERFPFVAPEAHGFRTAEADSDAARFAAICTGIAYVERLAYDVLGLLGADVTGPVALTGGATRNRWWNQLRTDVLGRPTLLPESAEAATGMAILAAAEPGTLTETAEAMVRVRERLAPDAEAGARMRPGYERLVDALADRGWLAGEVASAALADSAVPR